jgi:hypothetical protein
MQIFFLALFEEKLYKLLDHLNISRISGIRPDTGLQKRPDYLAGRISGASLVVTIAKLVISACCSS